MNRFSALFLAFFLFSSCKQSSESETTEDNTARQTDPETSSSRASRASDRAPAEDRSSSGDSESEHKDLHELLAKLRNSSDQEEQEDLFEEAILTTDPEEHDELVSIVINNLNTPRGADTQTNLLTTYLDISSMMEPAVQLPSLVRILEEGNPLPLQRTVIDGILRENLGIKQNENVQDWKPLVTEYLKASRKLILENQ